MAYGLKASSCNSLTHIALTYMIGPTQHDRPSARYVPINWKWSQSHGKAIAQYLLHSFNLPSGLQFADVVCTKWLRRRVHTLWKMSCDLETNGKVCEDGLHVKYGEKRVEMGKLSLDIERLGKDCWFSWEGRGKLGEGKESCQGGREGEGELPGWEGSVHKMTPNFRVSTLGMECEDEFYERIGMVKKMVGLSRELWWNCQWKTYSCTHFWKFCFLFSLFCWGGRG